MIGIANKIKEALSHKFCCQKCEIILNEQIEALCTILDGEFYRIRRELYLISPSQSQHLDKKLAEITQQEINYIGGESRE